MSVLHARPLHQPLTAWDACPLTNLLLGLNASVLQALAEGEHVRILEVGSGSGGTSAVVMAALAPFGDGVDFVYTDLSPQLVAYGRKTYGATYGFARFHVLDIERDPAPQVGFRWCCTSGIKAYLCIRR